MRRPSEDSLNTLVTEAADDNASVFSDETLSAGSTPIFGRRLASYTRIRELPVVAGTYKAEMALYASMKAVAEGHAPLLLIQLNKLHFLKKNAPLLTTYLHAGTAKTEHCRIYFKILQNNLTCYVLMFATGPNVVLFNNALKPHTDLIYKDSKIRIYGASGAASTFGNGAIKLFLLHQNSPLLADALDPADLQHMASIKDFHLRTPAQSSPLYDAVVTQQRNEILRLVSQAEPIVNVPFAAYMDHGDRKVDGVKVHGCVRLFESVEGSDEATLTEDSLIVATVMLVLVEQEITKMRGNNKPSYVL